MNKFSFMMILLSIGLSQNCDDNMLMFDCDGLGFCNNEPDFDFDCYVNNEFCEDFNQDGITDSWVGDGWCDDGEWGYDFQCEEYSFDCGDCNDDFSNSYGYCIDIPQAYTFNHGGISRQYYIYEPNVIQENPPLIFLMHGFTGSALGISSYSGMNALADMHGFVVCYPQGTSDQNGDNFWNVGYNFHENQSVDDVSFIVSLAEYLHNEYGYDANNTFAAGMSNGAEMSYKLACETDEFFNAIAPVAGTMFGESWTSCNPNPMPVLEIHGTNDDVTLWEGDDNDTYWGPYPGVEQVIDFWVEENDCINNEDIILQGMNTIKHRYFDCIDDAEVWLYEVQNGGHDWPGYSSEEIWNFFSEYIVVSLGDINGDSNVNVQDIILAIDLVLNNEYNIAVDFNYDNIINVTDIVQLVNIILN
jgi:polyhydroxybutyrate depolymerase